jgi:hypothetical protein
LFRNQKARASAIVAYGYQLRCSSNGGLLYAQSEFNAGSSGVEGIIGLRDTFAKEAAGKATQDFPSILHPFRYPPRDTLR